MNEKLTRLSVEADGMFCEDPHGPWAHARVACRIIDAQAAEIERLATSRDVWRRTAEGLGADSDAQAAEIARLRAENERRIVSAARFRSSAFALLGRWMAKGPTRGDGSLKRDTGDFLGWAGPLVSTPVDENIYAADAETLANPFGVLTDGPPFDRPAAPAFTEAEQAVLDAMAREFGQSLQSALSAELTRRGLK